MNEQTSMAGRFSAKRLGAPLAHPHVRWDRAALIAVMLTIWTVVLKVVAGL